MRYHGNKICPDKQQMNEQGELPVWKHTAFADIVGWKGITKWKLKYKVLFPQKFMEHKQNVSSTISEDSWKLQWHILATFLENYFAEFTEASNVYRQRWHK